MPLGRDIFAERMIQAEASPVLLLAPMQGITTPLFRDAVIRLGGVDLVATEFVRIGQENQKVPPFVRHSVPLQIQFMAKDPQVLATVIHKMQPEQIKPDDWLDLNAGCPSKRVNSHGAGAALLCDPKKLRLMLEEIRGVWQGVLSVKIRLGFNSVTEFDTLLEVLKDAPLDFITIHAKTRAAATLDSSAIHKELLAQAAQVLPFPVIGNGEIWSAAEALTLIKECGLRGVMFGRPAIANPFIFKEVRDLLIGLQPSSDEERKKQLLSFIRSLLKEFQALNNRSLCGAWKELCFWFSKNPLLGLTLFEKTKRLTTLTQCEEVLLDFD